MTPCFLLDLIGVSPTRFIFIPKNRTNIPHNTFNNKKVQKLLNINTFLAYYEDDRTPIANNETDHW